MVDGTGGGERGPWAELWTRMRRRRACRAGLLGLVALAALAIYAPLFASDRPYYLVAVERGDFDRARRGLVAPAQALAELARGGEEGYRARQAGGARLDYGAALAAERTALTTRLATLARSLGDEAARSRDELGRRAAALVEDARAGSVVARDPDALVALARELAGVLDPAELELRPVRSFPLFAALSPLEVGLQVLWLFVLAWPFTRGRARFGPRAAVGAALGAGLVWGATVGGGAAFESARYKEGLTRGEIVAERVLFPPVPFGLAETHPEEGLRPPTWLAASELGPDGAYLHGARVPRADASGFRPATTPVEVRAGEPGVNSAWRHPLGTDATGRDLLARLVHGARASLTVGLAATVLLCVVGVLVGSVAGSRGGGIDLVLSRLIEVVVTFPLLFLALVLVAFLGPSLWNVVAVIGLVGWTGVARLARSEFQRECARDYALAARALGFSWARVAFRHVLPNALGPLLVAATFSVANAILIESALSFLGFGVRVPIATWGALVSESRDVAYWWLQVFPGACLFLTVLCVHGVGDSLRDALDARGGAS